MKWRRMKWLGLVTCMGETRRVMLGKRERRKPSGRSRLGWICDIKIGLTVMDWFNMADVRDKRLLYVW
jgi:hypothetical protein